MESESLDNSTASDENPKARPLRKRHRVIGEKVCQVCGDKALAHHFGALACETCKAFFRRNALKSEEMRKCAFQGHCKVSQQTRRFCPPCRLQKCFDVGMKADLILDDSERRERMQKVQEKRAKQCKVEMDSNSNNVSLTCLVTTTGQDIASPETPLPIFNIEVDAAAAQPVKLSVENYAVIQQSGNHSPFQRAVRNLGNEMYDQGTSESSRHDTPVNFSGPVSAGTASFCHQNSTSYIEMSVPSVRLQSQPQAEKVLGAQYCNIFGNKKAIAPFEHIPREQLPSDPFMYWRLSEDERCLLTKLSAAYEDTVLSILQKNLPKTLLRPEDITTESYLYECEAEVRYAIDFAKRLEDFQRLRTDEQVAILKASTDQVLALRGCALYISEKDAWLTCRGYFTRDHAEILCPEHPFLDICTTFCKIIKDIVKNDFTLYALLHCVVLFDPSDEKIVNRQLVNSIRDKYIILLRHYLQSVYSYRHSDKYLTALQEKLSFYRELSRENKPLIKKFFPSIPNQLLVEILDLD